VIGDNEAATVYQQCRRAMLNWQWPPGGRIVISELQARFRSRAAVARAMYHLELEGYIFQPSRGRYTVIEIDETEIKNHYRSIDFGYGEAVTAMIRFMKDGSIDENIMRIFAEVVQNAIQAKMKGAIDLDNIFHLRYYYTTILAASKNFELMNYVLSVAKLRYNRWAIESIDDRIQDTIFSLNIRLHGSIMRGDEAEAASLFSQIFDEYRRLIEIYIATRPQDESHKPVIDYDLVGDENPSNYPVSSIIDSQEVGIFIERLKKECPDNWPYLFVERLV
jgi:DNA-binding GntR family transcriptional regulator